ncbi:MAG TPA: hypothetical protein DCQ31_02470 [Bacteroidales bacterium]|nr:hypothetical protein [Bacteroidales bacterium]
MEHKIDFSYLDGVAQVSNETAIELIDYFLLENNKWLSNLHSSAKNLQSGQLSEVLHKLKGAIRVLGLHYIDTFIEAWEQELKQGNFSRTAQYLKQMDAFFEIAIIALKKKRNEFLS